MIFKNNSFLLDYLLKEYKIKNDRQLSKLIDISTPSISLMRSGKMKISNSTILKIHKQFGLSVDKIEQYLKKQGK